MGKTAKAYFLLLYMFAFLPLYPYFREAKVTAIISIAAYLLYVGATFLEREENLTKLLLVPAGGVIIISLLTKQALLFVPLSLFPFLIRKFEENEEDTNINLVVGGIAIGAVACFLANNSAGTLQEELVMSMPYVFAIIAGIIYSKTADGGIVSMETVMELSEQIDEQDQYIQSLESKIRDMKGDSTAKYLAVILGLNFKSFDYIDNIHTIVRTLNEATNAIFTGYYEFNPEYGKFDYKYGTGESKLFIKQAIPAGFGVVGKVFNTKQYVYVKDILSTAKDEYTEKLYNGVDCILTVPIMVHNRIAGAVTLGMPTIDSQKKELDIVNLCCIVAERAGTEFEKMEEHEETEKKSITDKLTGMYNRLYFDTKVKEEFENAMLEQSNIAFLEIDLDFFKQMNDTHGHDFGDKVLKTASEVFRKSIRSSDYAFRTGGDEFAILLMGADADAAYRVAKNIRLAYAKKVEELHLYAKKDGKDVKSSFSMGIAVYPDKSIRSAEELIKKADNAVYYTKQHGKNNITIAKVK